MSNHLQKSTPTENQNMTKKILRKNGFTGFLDFMRQYVFILK